MTAKKFLARLPESRRLLGYKVMRHKNGYAVSMADPRQSFMLKKGAVVGLSGQGIFLSLNKQYVITYYAGNDENAIITFEFDPKDVTWGNLTDRETEFTVSKARIKDFEITYDDD